jgi:CheY-like chemotaxis protein
MPHASGLEVLTWIRGRDQFRDTRVVMLTSSSQSSDIAMAYAKGADAYLVKPTSLDRFREFVEDLLQVCAQPRRAGVLQIRGCVASPASAAKA